MRVDLFNRVDDAVDRLEGAIVWAWRNRWVVLFMVVVVVGGVFAW